MTFSSKPGTHLDTGLGRDHQLWTGVEFLAHLVPHIQHRYEYRLHTYGALSTSIRKRFGWVGRRPTIVLAGEDAEGRAHDASAPPTQGPREMDGANDGANDGASDGAHSTTATSPVFPTQPSIAKPPPRTDAPTDSTESQPDDEPDPFIQARKRRWAELIRHVWLDDPEVCERCGGHMRIAGVCISPRDDDPTPSDPPSPDRAADQHLPDHLPEPDPWAEEENAEDTPDSADTTIDPSEDPDD